MCYIFVNVPTLQDLFQEWGGTVLTKKNNKKYIKGHHSHTLMPLLFEVGVMYFSAILLYQITPYTQSQAHLIVY